MLSVFRFCLYSLSCTFHISLIVLTSSMNISTSWLPHIIYNNTKTTRYSFKTLGLTTQINVGYVAVLRQADASINVSYLIFNVLLEASLTQGRTRYMFNSSALVHRVQWVSDVLSSICFYVLLDAIVRLIQLPHSIGHRCFICLKVDINVHKTVKLVLKKMLLQFRIYLKTSVI